MYVYLLIDSNRTLCLINTGKVFFDLVKQNQHISRDIGGSGDLQKAIFKQYPDYMFQLFLEIYVIHNDCSVIYMG